MFARQLLALAALALAVVPGRAHGDAKPAREQARPAQKATASKAAARPKATQGKKPAAKAPARAPASSTKKGAKKPQRPSRAAVSRLWHTAPPGRTAPLDANGRPMLVLQALNVPERVELTATSERGGFGAHDLDRAAHLLRDTRTGNEHPIDPRLLDVLYRVAVHFSAPEIRIISGYRTPRPGKRASNHAKGRAVDLVVPGRTDEEVAKFVREQGFVGVGVYPTSGFLHIDVRERSFFWVDYSAPGKRNRTRGILADLAAKSDARALARGERGVDPFSISTDFDAALAATAAKATTSEPKVDEDEDEDDDG